ncbi:Protein phosphatase 1 regulatory subunit 37 [Armadillidium nasatum]|uniref:Protein phosphatase 1 regulatory subunit 37 n=1 Tax=Armadillidium nasatum TaxID=96803 RepID=A0A5N5TDL6_9CRUS|nr:Protein phosphatase 1 regulatory subunit 37 [Armadillidium nasatum]
MASEEHRLTDSLNNAENDSESEIQETLARQTEDSETLSTISPSAQLKENVEANTTVPNGMISTSPFQGDTSHDIKRLSESSADCPKEASNVLEETLANVSLKDNDAPKEAQIELPMEDCEDSFVVQDQISQMRLDDKVPILSEEYSSNENVFQTSKAIENVSVINNIDCSDKIFTSSTSVANKEQLLDLVIDVTSEKPILEPENNSDLEEITPEDISAPTSEEEQLKSGIDDLERFLSCTDTKIPSDSVQSNTKIMPSDDLLLNVTSYENFKKGASPEKTEGLTQQKYCLSSSQDPASFSLSGKQCKSIDIFTQSSGSKITQTLQQSPIKSASCTDTLLNFCKNMNVSEPEISPNTRNDLKSKSSLHSESNGSFLFGRKEQCITTALTCEKHSPTISLITDEFASLSKESNTSFSQVDEALNTMSFMTDLISDDHPSCSVRDPLSMLNSKGEDCCVLPTATNTPVLPSKDVNTESVFKGEEFVEMFLSEDEESSIKPPIEFQDSEPINIMHNNDSNLQLNTNELDQIISDELKGTSEEIKIPSNVTVLEDNSVCVVKKENVVQTSEFLDENFNDSQRLQTGTATLPSICEKHQEEEESKFEEIYDEMEFNLQNSPMLRRSRQSTNEKGRRDCRFIFGSDSPCGNHNSETDVNQKSFVALRDSLDISKLASCLGDAEMTKSVEIEDRAKVTLSDDGSSASFEKMSTSPVSYQVKSSPPHYQSSKVMSRKKKTSIKTEKEKDNNRRVSFPEDESRLITSYLEPVNPWYHMSQVSTDAIAEAYRSSCSRHKTRALPAVLQQIAALPIDVGGRIECLNVRNHKLEAVQCESLEEIFRRVQFYTLDFENCELDDDSAIPLFDMMEFYDSAIHLNISHNSKIGNRGWQACARMLKRTPSLRILEAKNSNLSEQNMPIICKALRIQACAHICKDIAEQQNSQRNKDNRENSLSSTQVGLTALVLWNNHITVQGVQYISLMLHSNYTLETLNLGRNNLTSEGLLLLKTSLLRNKSLRRIGLQATRIGNEGAVALAECIADNQILSRIDLRENSIQVAGLLALSRSLKINTSVIQLDLDANPRAEPSTDLSDQHLTLYQEIKNLCQRNLTNDHLRREIEEKAEETKVENPLLLSPEKRKISLTCETTKCSEDKDQESSSVAITVSESKRYRSPDPRKHDTDITAPTIVVSSPNKAVRGFNIKEGDKSVGRDFQRNASLDLPISVTSSSSPSSDSSSPQDDVFLEDEGGETAITPNKAPLASIEGGSVDSDSEDSDLMTQSSDSTRSDEVRISVEESTPPLPAWGGGKTEASISIATTTTTNTTTTTYYYCYYYYYFFCC